MVSIEPLIYRIILFCLILLFAVFLAVRIRRYPKNLRKLMTMATVFAAIGSLGRFVDIIALFKRIPHYSQIHVVTHVISIGGLVWVFISMILTLERYYIPIAASEKLRELRVSTGAYLFPFRAQEEILGLLKGTEAAILAVTRNPGLYTEFGDRVKKIWVSMAVETAVPPTKLHVMQDAVIRFLKDAGRGIVIIDCVEYLILYNDFETVFKFLTSLKDYVMVMDSTLVVAVKRGTLSERELTILGREFRLIKELTIEG